MKTDQKEKPIEATAEFWLGRLAAVARLEKSGRLTKHQAMDEVQATFTEMQHQQKTNNPTK